MNIVIMSRTKSTLDQVAKEISIKHICIVVLKPYKSRQNCTFPCIKTYSLQQIVSSPPGNSTGQKVRVIIADFTDENIFSEIEEQLKDLCVGILGSILFKLFLHDQISKKNKQKTFATIL